MFFRIFLFPGKLQSVFYVSSLVTACWLFFWTILITDDPAGNKLVSREELAFILEHRVIPRSRRSMPLAQIVTNVPVISMMLMSFANDWGLNTLLTEGPNFMSKVLKKDITTVREEEYFFSVEANPIGWYAELLVG